jgi:hypothetical protein
MLASPVPEHRGKRLGRRPVNENVVGRIREELVTGAGILKTTRALGVRTGTVHRVKRSMAAVAARQGGCGKSPPHQSPKSI